MRTEDLVKILITVYIGLFVCLFAIFQSHQATEKILINQIQKTEKEEKELSEEKGIIAFTEHYLFKMTKEIFEFFMNSLRLLENILKVFF